MTGGCRADSCEERRLKRAVIVRKGPVPASNLCSKGWGDRISGVPLIPSSEHLSKSTPGATRPWMWTPADHSPCRVASRATHLEGVAQPTHLQKLNSVPHPPPPSPTQGSSERPSPWQRWFTASHPQAEGHVPKGLYTAGGHAARMIQFSLDKHL